MSEFEDKLSELHKAYRERAGDDDVPTIGLLAVAEGLAEVISLLRPLVDTVTARPEPLKLPTMWVVRCGHSVGAQGGPCSLSVGHQGEHGNGVLTWGDPHPPMYCGQLLTSTQPGGPRCHLRFGHVGVHTDGTVTDDGEPVVW